MSYATVCTFLMNLDTAVNRLHDFERHYGPHFTRVPAVDSSTFENKDYPCLPKHGHLGYKALTSTMVKSMETALLNESCTYAAIFEDDASPPHNFHQDMPTLVKMHEPIDVLYMDGRNAAGGGASVFSEALGIKSPSYIPGCCLMATIYSRQAMQYLSKSMNWKSSIFMQFYSMLRKRIVDSDDCLNDWMQANLLGMTKLRVASYPVIYGHGKYKTQVSV